MIKINEDCESECCLAGHLYPCSPDLNLIPTERGERERSLQRLLIQHCSYGLAYLLQACLWAAVYCMSKREIKRKHIKWLPLLCPHLKDTGPVWSINPIVNANSGNYSEVLLEKSFLAFLPLLLIQENKRERDQETAQAGFRLSSNEQHCSGGQGLAAWLWQHLVHIYHYAGKKTLQFFHWCSFKSCVSWQSIFFFFHKNHIFYVTVDVAPVLSFWVVLKKHQIDLWKHIYNTYREAIR